jgi:hypothetical protein
MTPPFGADEPKQVEAKPEVIIPLMTAGWRQCEPPVHSIEEVNEDVG